MKAKRWVLAKQFSGEITDENLKLEEFDLPDELEVGEVLFQAVYLSVDPYMRVFFNPEGKAMQGEQLTEVIKTRNGMYPLGTLVLTKGGWQSHFISKGEGDDFTPIRFDLGATPRSYTLGILGMPGATAYLGLEKCEPKANETVLVSSAAGAVGHVAGQLAKHKGCTVIGIVGSDAKADWCKNELGFDHVINYKKGDYSEALKAIAPQGVDIYVDLVGGDYYHTIVNKHMKKFGRIVVIGSIQTYNDTDQRKYNATNFSILGNQLTVKGFGVYSYFEEWPRAFVQMNKLIQEGRLKTKEHVYVGFEKMRDAFVSLFTGEGIGKVLVKAVNVQTNYP